MLFDNKDMLRGYNSQLFSEMTRMILQSSGACGFLRVTGLSELHHSHTCYSCLLMAPTAQTDLAEKGVDAWNKN